MKPIPSITECLQMQGFAGHGASVGWRVGVAPHPCNTQQVVLAAGLPDGTVYFLVLGRIDIMRPYTDTEVRAMILHRWGQEDQSPPEGIRLIVAQLAVEQMR